MKMVYFSGIMCLLIFFILLVQKNPTVTIAYDRNIDALPIKKLRNLRYLSDVQRKQLFHDLKFPELFNSEAVCKRITESSNNPHIILWFTDHYGRIPQTGFLWYKHEIVDRLSAIKPTFWLVDLAAWRFLSLKEKIIAQDVDFREFKGKKEQGKDLLSTECPLIKEAGSYLKEDPKKSYRVLKAQAFFAWLLQLPFSIQDMDAHLIDRLVRNDLKEGAARFTLRNIGFKPLFLECTTLLAQDHTQLFPLLQYLEGIYYVFCIVLDCVHQQRTGCDVIFLLPNKEFTYYANTGELPFTHFGKNLEWLLRKMLPASCKVKVRLFFYPCAYGNDFYDQPFEENGPFLTTDVLQL